MAYKHRVDARVDENQQAIVKELRKIKGVSVELGHDDILVGYKAKTFWFEIKSKKCLKKDGTLKAGTLKPSQVKLLNEYNGHYKVVWAIEQILEEIGIDAVE